LLHVWWAKDCAAELPFSKLRHRDLQVPHLQNESLCKSIALNALFSTWSAGSAIKRSEDGPHGIQTVRVLVIGEG
jgi:hypothetical protein